jgi:hypothetical protein
MESKPAKKEPVTSSLHGEVLGLAGGEAGVRCTTTVCTRCGLSIVRVARGASAVKTVLENGQSVEKGSIAKKRAMHKYREVGSLKLGGGSDVC